ncbi:glutamate--trna ligase [Quercus suber]|uniref:Glutamate--trna ligase n=1 Tax=Quercus suber TaxID=58331 RepID=A0AAW0K2L7_QUESU
MGIPLPSIYVLYSISVPLLWVLKLKPKDAVFYPYRFYSTQTQPLHCRHKLHGTYVLLRYIARVASLPNFYEQYAYESGQIDEWLEYAPIFSLGPAFDKIYVMVVVGAANEPF